MKNDVRSGVYQLIDRNSGYPRFLNFGSIGEAHNKVCHSELNSRCEPFLTLETSKGTTASLAASTASSSA